MTTISSVASSAYSAAAGSSNTTQLEVQLKTLEQQLKEETQSKTDDAQTKQQKLQVIQQQIQLIQVQIQQVKASSQNTQQQDFSKNTGALSVSDGVTGQFLDIRA